MSRTGSNLFLVSRVDLPRSDRIWKCLPDVAGDRLQFVQNDSEGFFFFFLFFFSKLPDSTYREPAMIMRVN